MKKKIVATCTILVMTTIIWTTIVSPEPAPHKNIWDWLVQALLAGNVFAIYWCASKGRKKEKIGKLFTLTLCALVITAFLLHH